MGPQTKKNTDTCGVETLTDRTEEMDGMDLRGRMVALEHRATGYSQRLTALETWRQHSEVDGARKDEQFKHMDTRFSTLDSKIDAISLGLGNKIDAVNNTLSWIGKLVIGAVVLAVVAFIVNGGLNIPS